MSWTVVKLPNEEGAAAAGCVVLEDFQRTASRPVHTAGEKAASEVVEED